MNKLSVLSQSRSFSMHGCCSSGTNPAAQEDQQLREAQAAERSQRQWASRSRRERCFLKRRPGKVGKPVPLGVASSCGPTFIISRV